MSYLGPPLFFIGESPVSRLVLFWLVSLFSFCFAVDSTAAAAVLVVVEMVVFLWQDRAKWPSCLKDQPPAFNDHHHRLIFICYRMGDDLKPSPI